MCFPKEFCVAGKLFFYRAEPNLKDSDINLSLVMFYIQEYIWVRVRLELDKTISKTQVVKVNVKYHVMLVR